MKTKNRMRTMAVSVAGMLLFSGVFLAADASAQTRGRSVRMPSNSTALRGGGGGTFAPHSGGQGLKAVGNLFGSMGGGYYGHESHHDRYSGAEAFRDVGLANAAVGLVGTLVGGYSYPQYPAVVAAPVAVVAAPAPYPVAVVSSPSVVVGSYPYGYAPSPYPYTSYYGYGAPYYYGPSSYPYGYYGCGTSYYSPHSYPYGGYGYGNSYYNSPRVCAPPYAMGHPTGHHGASYYGGNHGPSGAWQTGHGGSYGQSGSWQTGHGGSHGPSGSWQTGHGGTQTPRYQGQGMQAPRSSYHGGGAPSMSGPRGGGGMSQHSGMHASGQSRRIR